MSKSRFQSIAIRVLFAYMIAGVAVADGILHLGNVRTREIQATVPITLQGEVSEGVASMNFQLNYDPNAVRVVSVDTGDAARDTGKQIQWHEVAPGRLNVVLSGFNQETLRSGEIAQLTVEPAGSDVRNARLHIGSSTFASIDGDLIPSKGSTGALAFRIREQENDSDTTEPTPPAPPPSTPEEPEVPTPASSLGPALPGASNDTPSPPTAVPEAVERRLMAARQNAESVRSLLGASRDEDEVNSDGSTDNSVSTSATGRALEAVNAPLADNEDPTSTLGTTITPEQKLENAVTSGHNSVSSRVLDNEASPFSATALALSLAVAVGVGIALMIIVRRGTS